MATNKKITQLDELTPATWADDDVIAIVDISAQETKKIQLSTFRGAVTGVSSLNADTPLTVDSATGDVTISVAINGGGTINAVFDEDNMASNSPTALATQQSIKAYVDSQVGTVDTLAEILANGNTTGGTDIVVSSGDAITTNTISETTAASGVTIDSLLVKDGGITAAGTSTFAGQTITDLGAVTTADINGGTIDGTVIGGSSAAAISGTTGAFSGSVTALDFTSEANFPALILKDTNSTSASDTTGGVLLRDSSNNNVASFRAINGDAFVKTEHAAGKLIFQSASSSEAMRITSSGDVGIGTTSPDGKLDIATGGSTDVVAALGGTFPAFTYRNGTGTWFHAGKHPSSDYFYIGRGATPTTNVDVVVDSSGNVGIGTTSPSKPLHVNSSTDEIFRLETPDNQTGNIYQAIHDASGELARLGMFDSSRILRLNNLQSDGEIAFFTNNSEAVRIDSSGNVGIGTSSPSSPGGSINLLVDGTTPIIKSAGTTSARYDLATTTANSYSIISLNDNSGSPYLQLTSGSGVLNHYYDGPTHIWRNTAGTERMRINSSGGVGIGTTAPDGNLNVHRTSASNGWIINAQTAGVGNDSGFYMDSSNNIEMSVRDGSGTLAAAVRSSGNTFFNSGGNVGIGTSSPSTLLHLASTGSAILTLEADTDNVTESDNARIELSQDGGNTTGHMGYGSGSNGIDIWNDYNDYVRIGTNNTERLRIVNNGVVRPATDNVQPIGASSNRWSVVYAGTGTINTSDEREKQQIADLDDAERRVAVAIKGLVKKYKYNDAVQLKGDDARIHVGVIAQEVIAAFAAEGLDATRYALLCHDTWEAEPEEVDKNGNVINPGIEAGERYGIRYDELLAFMIAAL